MKSITIRKNWIEAIERLHETESFHRLAIWCIYTYLSTGKTISENDKIRHIISIVSDDVRRLAAAREKARERREKKKQEKAAAESAPTIEKLQNQPTMQSVAEVDESQREEYEKYPELYMFDGFTAFLCSNGGAKFRPVVNGDYNFFELICHFRDWVLSNNKIKEITHLNTFRGLFKVALPHLMWMVSNERKESAVA